MANEEWNGKKSKDILIELVTDVKWIKDTQTKDLSAINEHLKTLNNNVSKNAARSIENMSSIRTHWKLIIAIIGIGGAILAILLEVLLKAP